MSNACNWKGYKTPFRTYMTGTIGTLYYFVSDAFDKSTVHYFVSHVTMYLSKHILMANSHTDTIQADNQILHKRHTQVE